ncbi:hypothetical protein MMC28_011116 [Mycoblastus sanguinarius]|nr:hypothetical protein [Mycoblastus sanguinarius]
MKDLETPSVEGKETTLQEPLAAYEGAEAAYHDSDVFGQEEDHDVGGSSLFFPEWSIMIKSIRYKTLSWQLVAVLMIAEIVSNGMLSLPSSLAVVGLVPGIVIIVFLGVFGLFTAWILIKFKLRHPEVHNMGDAGLIIFGPVGREVLSFGTIVFAVFATGSQLLAGQIALGALSDSKLCLMLYTGIFAIPTLICSLPRTLDQLSWLSVPAVISILVAGIVGMIGAGINFPIASISVAMETNFVTAFISVTNPVFAYAGHFMFFILISEMRHPTHAMRAAYVLQIFATSFYVVFAVVLYVYVGPTVTSPAFSSLPEKWQKAAYGIAIPNFLIAGSLYSHTAAKLLFVRFFRKSRHLYTNTVLGWGVWIILIFIMNATAFVLAVGVPIFNYLVGIAASLFASWYTYGLAGAFWLYDAWVYKGGLEAWKRSWPMTALSMATLAAGGLICVAGMYVTIKQIVDAYANGQVSAPFNC